MHVSLTLVAATILMACGCGRLGFDPPNTFDDAPTFSDADQDDSSSDSPLAIGHDEDGDGLPDFVDNCPHIANVTQANADADQAGDACDSFPTTQNTLRFYSLLTADLNKPDDSITGTWIKGDDVWTANDANNANLHILGPTDSSEIFIGYDVIDVIGTAANHELSVRAEVTAMDAFYYGHYYSSGASNAGVSNDFYDGAGNYLSLQNSGTGQPFALGPATLAVRFDVNTKEIRTRFSNSTGNYDLTSPAPMLLSMRHYHLDAVGAEIQIRYFAIVGQ